MPSTHPQHPHQKTATKISTEKINPTSPGRNNDSISGGSSGSSCSRGSRSGGGVGSGGASGSGLVSRSMAKYRHEAKDVNASKLSCPFSVFVGAPGC